MSYTSISVTEVTDNGAKVAAVEAVTGSGSGQRFENDGDVRLLAINDGTTGSATLTIHTGATLRGKAVADGTVALGTGTANMMIIGPFPVDLYNQPSGDDRGGVRISVTGDGAADVLLFPFK